MRYLLLIIQLPLQLITRCPVAMMTLGIAGPVEVWIAPVDHTLTVTAPPVPIPAPPIIAVAVVVATPRIIAVAVVMLAPLVMAPMVRFFRKRPPRRCHC